MSQRTQGETVVGSHRARTRAWKTKRRPEGPCAPPQGRHKDDGLTQDFISSVPGSVLPAVSRDGDADRPGLGQASSPRVTRGG